jgi:hypothetical protein
MVLKSGKSAFFMLTDGTFVGFFEQTVVNQVGADDEYHRYHEQKGMPIGLHLLGKKGSNACCEQNQGPETMMMFAIACPQSHHTNAKSQENHEILKRDIIDDIDPKNGQTSKQ